MRLIVFTILALLISLPVVTAAVSDEPVISSRQRISIDDGWRFRKGDPEGVDASRLLYEVLPAVNDTTDDKPADAKPKEAEKATTAPVQTVLKSWILPTANPLINDPAKRAVRPAEEPALNIPCLAGGFDDGSWQQIDLPHDWAIEGPFNQKSSGVGGGMGRLPTPGVGWYRRKLEIPAGDAGKSIFLDVDGAMSYATVWLNGHLVGGWPYGYSSWQVNLTPYVVFGGENQLAIRLNNLPDSSRWYPGGGIYRNVWLTKVQPVHVAHWGTRVTTPQVSADSAMVALAVTIDNDSDAAANVSVATKIYALDADAKRIGDAIAVIEPAESAVVSHASATLSGSATLANPRLWGPAPSQKPNRYVAVTTVTQQGKEIDRYETRFGIRSITFDPDKGLLINGQHVGNSRREPAPGPRRTRRRIQRSCSPAATPDASGNGMQRDSHVAQSTRA